MAPRDYTQEYAILAGRFQRATASATTDEERTRIRALYDQAVSDVALANQREADERRAASPAQRRPLTGMEEAKGPARSFVQGATFGFGEELESLPYAIPGGETAEQARQRIRGEIARYREARPKTAIAAELAGAVAPTILSRGRSLGASAEAGLGARAAAAFGRSPALQGALAGAGYTEGGIPERLAGATVGAAVGKTLGAAVSRGVGAAGRAIERVRQGVRPTGPNVGTTVAARLASEAGVEDLPAVIQNAQTASPETRMMDILGTPGQRAAAGIRLVGGRPGQVVEQTMAERLASAPTRLMRGLESTGRLLENVVQTIDDMITSGNKAARPLYRAFEEAAPKAIPEIDELLSRPFGQQVLARARTIAANEGREFIEPAVASKASGLLSATGEQIMTKAKPATYNPRSLDDIKKAMDAVIYGSKYGSVQAGQGGLGPAEVQSLKNIRRQFVDAVDAAYPDTYAAARQAWAGEYAARAALEDGLDAAKKRVDVNELSKMVRELEPSEREFFRRGYIAQLRQRVEDNLLNPGEIKTPAFTKRMQAVFGDESDAIVNALTQESALTRTAQRVMGGSPTAERFVDIESPFISGKAIRATGERTRTAARIAETIEARLRAPRSERARMEVGQMLMRPVSEAEALVQSLQREQAALRRGQQYRQAVESPLSRLFAGRTVGAFSSTPSSP